MKNKKIFILIYSILLIMDILGIVMMSAPLIIIPVILLQVLNVMLFINVYRYYYNKRYNENCKTSYYVEVKKITIMKNKKMYISICIITLVAEILGFIYTPFMVIGHIMLWGIIIWLWINVYKYFHEKKYNEGSKN